MIAQRRSPSQRLHADDLHGIGQEGREHADGIGTSADTGHHLVRQVSGHADELFPRLFPDAVLEIPYHQREGMGAGGGTDAVDGVLVLPGIGLKGGVHRFLQGLQSEAHRDHIGSQHLHAGDVGGLFGNVHFPHIDIALHAEVGGSGGQRHAVLAGSGLGDEFLLSHVFGQKSLAHAVVEFVGAGMVQVLPLQVDLGAAQEVGQILAVVHRGGTSLEIPADAPKFRNELGRLSNGVVSLGILLEGLDQLRILQIVSAVFSEISLRGGMFLQIVVVIAVLIHNNAHFSPNCLFSSCYTFCRKCATGIC